MNAALPDEPVAVGFLDGSLQHSALSKAEEDSDAVQPAKRRRRQAKGQDSHSQSQSQSQPPWRGAVVESAKDAGSEDDVWHSNVEISCNATSNIKYLYLYFWCALNLRRACAFLRSLPQHSAVRLLRPFNQSKC